MHNIRRHVNGFNAIYDVFRKGKVGSGTFSAQGISNIGSGASLSRLHIRYSHLESNGPLCVESFQRCQYHVWCRGTMPFRVFH